MISITVFHNNRREAMRAGYTKGDTVTEVYRYDYTPHSAEVSPLGIAEHAFRLFNIGDDPDFGTPDPRAVDYRERRNRSLSLGDVVRIDAAAGTIWLTVARAGFEEIVPPPVRNQPTHGTTPYESVQAQ